MLFENRGVTGQSGAGGQRPVVRITAPRTLIQPPTLNEMVEKSPMAPANVAIATRHKSGVN